jgi:2-aminoadipate transaminase
MFFWATAPSGVDTLAVLDAAVAEGVAYVPGAAFFVDGGSSASAGPSGSRSDRAVVDPRRTLRLSFVTLAPRQIDEAVQRLARAFRAQAAG